MLKKTQKLNSYSPLGVRGHKKKLPPSHDDSSFINLTLNSKL